MSVNDAYQKDKSHNRRDATKYSNQDRNQCYRFFIEVVLALSDAVPVLSVDDWLITAFLCAPIKGALVNLLIIVVGAVAPDEIVAGRVVVGHVEHTINRWMSELNVGLAALAGKSQECC